jgi:uncharacterized membrane protein YfcA
MFTFSAYQWIIAGLTGLIIGLSKTALPGIGILTVPLAAEILPVRQSTGFLHPMLVFADIFAVIAYKRHAVWRHLFRLLPFALAGVGIGYAALGRLDDAALKPIIGVIIILILSVTVYRYILEKKGRELTIPAGLWFQAAMGLFGGFTTMVSNTGGPIMALYLLSMRLPKDEYMGTGAWYFFIINSIKIPLSLSLGLITAQSLLTNLAIAPAILAGALVGLFFLKKVSQKVFDILVYALTFIGALRLLTS